MSTQRVSSSTSGRDAAFSRVVRNASQGKIGEECDDGGRGDRGHGYWRLDEAAVRDATAKACLAASAGSTADIERRARAYRSGESSTVDNEAATEDDGTVNDDDACTKDCTTRADEDAAADKEGTAATEERPAEAGCPGGSDTGSPGLHGIAASIAQAI
jgi:hypothetical protein